MSENENTEGDDNGKNTENVVEKQSAPPQSSGKKKIVELEDVHIYPDMPLPQYDNGPIKAYTAKDSKGKEKEGFIAYICEPSLIFRRKTAPFYREISSQSVLKLYKTNICYWPPAQEQRAVVIYHHTIGDSIWPKERTENIEKWKDSQTTKLLISPIVNALRELYDKNIYHGNIRPSNIYFASAGTDHPVILGDCLSTPPAYTQPVLFETIQRGLADPAARGTGHIDEDLYALGVTVACLLLPDNKLQTLTDENIIKNKVENGTYLALTEGERISSSMAELLRGLLHDDRELRWGIEELMGWLDGRRLTPQQAKKKKQAMRTLTFADRKYISIYPLALDIYKYKEEAVNLFHSGKLEEWLLRSVDDKDALERIENVHNHLTTQDASSAQEREYLISLMRLALAPDLPMHYKNMNMMLEGIGTALAKTYVLKHDLKIFHELFDNKLPTSQLYMQEQAHMLPPKMFKVFEQCRNAVRQTKVSEGLERCLYMLCPDAPCLSPRLEGYIIRNTYDLINAIEIICKKGNTPENLIDRHIAAFVSVRESQSIDSCLYDLNSKENHRLILANLKIFAAIQKRCRPDTFPSLGQYFAGRLSPVYERFHDREMRATLDEKIQKAAKNGDLIQMLDALNNHEVLERDMHFFKVAMQEHRALANERAILERGLQYKSAYGKTRGHNISVIVSAILSTILIVLVILSQMSGNSFL